MTEVTEITFEEIGLDIDGASFGLYSGTAYIDEDGAVCSMLLEGYRGSKKTTVMLKVPYQEPMTNNRLWIAAHLAEQIEAKCASRIHEALFLWFNEDRHIREHDYEFA